MKACLLIRTMPWYRRNSFAAGLTAVGYEVTDKLEPHRENIVVMWNRYGHYDHIAKQYELAGGKVVIAENGYLGREWIGANWYAISQNFHNGGGWFYSEDVNTPNSKSRWNSFGVEVSPWSKGGSEIVILETRSIGPVGIAEPRGWSETLCEKLKSKISMPIRIRKHPGERSCTPLLDDLRNAWAVITWGSGGALKALLAGIPVFYGFPKWIGAGAGELITGQTDFTNRPLRARLPVFQKLAWGMWRTGEIEKGDPFKWLLQ